MEMYNNPYNNSNHEFPSPPQLIKPIDRVNYNQPFSDVEREVLKILRKSDDRTETEEEYMEHVEAARARWACKSTISQREEDNKYDIIVNENLVEIKHHYSHIHGNEPPKGEATKANGFSKKSRYRMIKKLKTMRRDDLQLPLFVTLTYHDNQQDFQEAKKHLNTFFQRFRRIGTLKYIWKMEPQQRGAIHFHLMLFLPEEIYPEGYKKNAWRRLEYARMRISAAWNEIAQPGDIDHLISGTNVRSVDNWRHAAGYLAKYMKKEIDGNEWKDKDTGRFWAVSNNFDFRPYYRHTVDMQEVEEMKTLLKEICNASFGEFLAHAKKRLKQLSKIKQSNPPKYKRSVQKLMKRIKNQRRRYTVNLDKIEMGANVQAELSHIVAREIVPESIHFN